MQDAAARPDVGASQNSGEDMADEKDLADKAVGAVKKTATRGKKAAKGAIDAVGAAATAAATVAADAAKAAGAAVGDVAGDAVDAAKGAVGAVGDAAGDAVDAAKNAAGAVGEIAGDAVDAAKGAVGGVADAVGDVAESAMDMAGKGVGAVAGAGAAALGAAGALAGGLAGATKDATHAVGSYAGRGRLDGDEEKVDRTGGGWLIPLVGLVGLVGVAWYGAGLFADTKMEEEAPVVAAAPAAPAVPAWLTSIGDSLKANFAWLGLGGTAAQVIANGTAPDQAAKDGALAELQTALTASAEGKDARIIDNITVTGATDTPVGAALAGLGANPDVAACNKAFAETMAGRTINFTTGSAVINDDSRSLLNALTGIASACATHTIEVGGHTDTVGLPENNQSLSQSRAEAVKAFWVEAGVAATTLSAVGYGETKLKEATDDETANEANRRIEFVVSDTAPAAAQ